MTDPVTAAPDRPAADAPASATSTATSLQPPSVAVERYLDRSRRFAAVLADAADRADAPTPCEGWTVRDIVDHVISTQRDFLGRHDLLGDAAAPDLAEPARAFDDHLAATATALPAEVADRGYDGWFGPTTIGETMADFYGWDLTIHAWDVARAVGASDPIAEDEADDLARTADGWGDALYGDGICGPAVPVPDDAPAHHRLLGRLGRDPHWTPATAA